MNAKLLVVVVLGALVVAEAPALADIRIQVGGSLHVDGRIRIGRARRHRRVYRPVYVQPAPTVYYSEPAPQPPPCGCECETTCVQPAPEAAVVVAHSQPRHSWFGIGAYLSGAQLGDSDREDMAGEGAGLVGRLRFRTVELELALGGTEFENLDRRESKVGAALIVPLMRGGLQPYLVVGGGALMREQSSVETEFGYLEAGGGLAWNLGRLTLSGDVRWSARRELKDDDYHLQTAVVTEPEEERAVEARLTGIVYF